MNHVAFVLPGLDRLGGAEKQVLLLANGLSQRKWRVSMLALSGSLTAAASELSAAGISFSSVGMHHGLADPHGWLRYQLWIRRQRPDIVHSHLPHAAWLTRWSRLLAPAHIQLDTIHTASIGTHGRQIGYRRSRWLPDLTTAVSGCVLDAYRAAGLVRPTHAVVMPNGVDVETWKADAAERAAMRESLGIRDSFLWLSAGRLEPVKNYGSLLRAFAHLPASARLAIAGTGSQENELRILASALGIETRVRFLGFVPDLLPWTQAADAAVLSSNWEGLPMALLEAAACELPCVATAVAGSREIVVDQDSGFLIPPGNTDALSIAMAKLMHLPISMRKAMGCRARAHIIRHYSLESVLDRWEAIYRDLLRKHANEPAASIAAPPRATRWPTPPSSADEAQHTRSPIQDQ